MREDPIVKVRAWLLAGRPALRAEDLDDDTDLIDSRIVDSLQFTELVLLVEQLSGRDVLSEDLDPDKLRSLSRIRQSFFA